jgi:hypothetical protein
MDGPLLVYEATDSAAIAANLIVASDLPGPRPGCKNKRSTQRVENEFLATYRMPDGRVRITISASMVRQRDNTFVDFLASVSAKPLLESANA